MSQYSPAWFEEIGGGCLRSAKAVVPHVIALVGPRSVVDVGCGQGWWLSVFAEYGCEVLGVDGAYVQDQAIPPEAFRVIDLESDWRVSSEWVQDGDYDLAVSLEVGEHLDAAHAERLVENLTLLAPVVLFSAAIPAQGGVGHVNEQWPSYWVDMFAAHGFKGSEILRWEFWDDTRVECWYRQNMLLFFAEDGFDEHEETPIHNVVHPELWGIYRGLV